MTPIRLACLMIGLPFCAAGIAVMRACFLLLAPDRVAPEWAAGVVQRIAKTVGAEAADTGGLRRTALFSLPVAGVLALIGFGLVALALLSGIAENA